MNDEFAKQEKYNAATGAVNTAQTKIEEGSTNGMSAADGQTVVDELNQALPNVPVGSGSIRRDSAADLVHDGQN